MSFLVADWVLPEPPYEQKEFTAFLLSEYLPKYIEMEKESKVYYPVGGFEDIKAFEFEEFGDIENPNFVFTPETVIKMTDLASFRLVNAANFADRKEYDVAIEVTKSALWLLEILNKKSPYKEQET